MFVNALSFHVWCLVIIVSYKQVARSYRIIDIFFVHVLEIRRKKSSDVKKFQYTSKASRKHFTSSDILMKFHFWELFPKQFYLLSENSKLHEAIFNATWSVDKVKWIFCLGKMLNMCLIWLLRSSRKFAWNSWEGKWLFLKKQRLENVHLKTSKREWFIKSHFHKKHHTKKRVSLRNAFASDHIGIWANNVPYTHFVTHMKS